MNKYEKRIKELEEELLDLKIKFRIEENNRKDAERRCSLKNYNAIIIGYCFANCFASIIGTGWTFVICITAVICMVWIDKRSSK